MKFRQTTIYNGEQFEVPQCVQRIDHQATHGWQLRYGGTKLFSDGQIGAAAALALATKELLKRIARLPAPTTLLSVPNENKTNKLPVGISGPIVHKRPGSKVYQSHLSVSLPLFGRTARRRSVYIGTENTYTEERFERALAKSIKLREKAEETYREDATRARRAAGRVLQAQQAQG